MNLYELRYFITVPEEPGSTPCSVVREASTLMEACQQLVAQVPEAELYAVNQTHVGG